MIDFEEKTYQKILKKQMDRIKDDVDKREGSIIQTALGPEAWYLEGAYMELEKEQENAFLDTAVGEYLERKAREYGIEVKKATYSERLGVFSQEVPIGARFAALSKSPYLIFDVTELIGEEKGAWKYRMQCETAGTIGNEYAGAITPLENIQGLKEAQLTDILLSGSEREDSESLRARVYAKLRNPTSGGNQYDYLIWATEVEGVGAAKVFPLANGAGTVKVVVIGADMKPAENALIERVQEHIDGVRPIGATVTVVSAKEKQINITGKVRLGNGVILGSAQEQVREAVSDYLKQNAFGISYVSLARIGNLLLSVGGIEDYAELKINGGTQNIALADTDVAVVGTVRLEVMLA